MKNIVSLILLLIPNAPIQAQERSVYIEGNDRLQYSVKEVRVNPGTTVNLTMKTVSDLPKSQMAHNWVLLKRDTDTWEFVDACVKHEEKGYIDPALKDQIIAHTGILGGGEQETITFTAPTMKGRYRYVCTFPAHYVAGMKGWLIVK